MLNEDEYVFTEQAEYLDDDLLLSWNEEHPDEKKILDKLINPGAKVIVGPRGCGKTTLMKKAFLSMLLSGKQNVLPIYVNYKNSLSLEPVYKKNSQAIFIFKQWLLMKIYQSIFDILEVVDKTKQININELSIEKKTLNQTIHKLEIGQIDSFIDSTINLTINDLSNDLKKINTHLNLSRTVLLLDDAAHAFSNEEQRDFFDLFRQLKSKTIAPKAAIYPGITSYSSSFHVGHDAEEIDVWMRPDNERYLPFCKDLLKKRLPNSIFTELSKDENILELISYAAFGIPRSLLSIVNYIISEGEIKFTANKTRDSIKRHMQENINIFMSLKSKLPMYDQFIINGDRLYKNLLIIMKDYNNGKDIDKKAFVIGINEIHGIPNEIKKVFGFLQFSGLVAPRGKMSRGDKGIYLLYEIHYAALISSNAITVSKGFNTKDMVSSLKSKDSRIVVRPTLTTILGTLNVEEEFKLSLPTCQQCGEERISENQKFCMSCGAELKAISTFENVVNQDIKALPKITTKRVNLIKQHSKIRKIKDILMDSDFKVLRSIPNIGKFRAQETFSYAQEYIS